MSKWTTRKDANHATIEGAFLRMGCLTFDAHELGGGFPDLVVLYPPALTCRTYPIRLVECKNASTSYGRQGLNPLQLRLERLGWPIEVAQDIEDVATLVNQWGRPLRRRKNS